MLCRWLFYDQFCVFIVCDEKPTDGAYLCDMDRDRWGWKCVDRHYVLWRIQRVETFGVHGVDCCECNRFESGLKAYALN